MIEISFEYVLQFSIFVIPLQVETINHIEDMNITLLKKTGSKEVINRIELSELAAAIKSTGGRTDRHAMGRWHQVAKNLFYCRLYQSQGSMGDDSLQRSCGLGG